MGRRMGRPTAHWGPLQCLGEGRIATASREVWGSGWVTAWMQGLVMLAQGASEARALLRARVHTPHQLVITCARAQILI